MRARIAAQWPPRLVRRRLLSEQSIAGGAGCWCELDVAAALTALTGAPTPLPPRRACTVDDIVGAMCGREGLLPQPLLAARFGAGNKEAVFVICGRTRAGARADRGRKRARVCVFVRKSRANPSPPEALA